ncbi:MAG TPA: ABC transporter permease [Thermoanaerobaculia bacterium]|nr:ABC transporter permease [Thermoanaerobaculia bacterium]
MSFLQDLQYGARVATRLPGLTVAVLLTLALGIGATTTIFSAVDSALLKPLRYSRPDSLVTVWEKDQQRHEDRNLVSPFNFFRWKEQSRSFSDLAAISSGSATLSGDGSPEWLDTAAVSARLFPLLGVRPALGRTFAAEEDRPGSGHVAVLSDGLWRRRFGADPRVLGRVIHLDDETYSVVGVMPPGFEILAAAELWTPIALDPAEPPRGRNLEAVARLRPGATLAQAQMELDVVARQLAVQFPDFDRGWGVNLVSLRDYLAGDSRTILLLLLGAAGFVLLIASANAANLLLSRSAYRQKEIAVRIVLGAPRRRLLAQLLTESSLLAVSGGLLGLAVAGAGARLLVRLAPASLPQLAGTTLDLRVLAFTLVVSILVGLLFGLSPALMLIRTSFHQQTRESGTRTTAAAGTSRLRDVMVVGEIAVALLLLIGAGLVILSLRRLQEVNLGFQPPGVLTMRLGLPRSKYPEAQQQIAFVERSLERLASLPGVTSVAAASFLPLTGFGAANEFTVEDRPAPSPGQEPVANLRFVSPGYFSTLKIPLLKGRDLQPLDNLQSPFAVVVNSGTAGRLWPGEDALGKRIRLHWAHRVHGIREPLLVSATVVGIVGDIREKGFEGDPDTTLYFSMRQLPWNPMYLLLRTSRDPSGLTAAVRHEVESIDPNQPVYDAATLEERLVKTISQRRFAMFLLSLFAGLALVLAMIGLSAVISYVVSQRTHEIGIRMALGSLPREVVGLIVRQGLRLSLFGLILGLALAAVLTRLMTSLLYHVSGVDPLVYAGITAFVLTIALLACYIPAHRAARLDPVIALREE